jgi:hypothetical protein
LGKGQSVAYCVTSGGAEPEDEDEQAIRVAARTATITKARTTYPHLNEIRFMIYLPSILDDYMLLAYNSLISPYHFTSSASSGKIVSAPILTID